VGHGRRRRSWRRPGGLNPVPYSPAARRLGGATGWISTSQL
jgi:hypothetical protein